MTFPITRQGGSHAPVAPPRYEYIYGEVLTMDGGDIASGLPPGTDTLYMRARGGDVYWQFNIGFANGENSAGYTPENWMEVIGPIANLTALNFYGVAGAFIHIHYLKEVP